MIDNALIAFIVNNLSYFGGYSGLYPLLGIISIMSFLCIQFLIAK